MATRTSAYDIAARTPRPMWRPSSSNSILICAVRATYEGLIEQLDAGQVRHLRPLIERYRPELLPESLRPKPVAPLPTPPLEPDNVVKFPKSN